MVFAVNYDGVTIKQVAGWMVIGEGPFWDFENNILLFVDASRNCVYRLFENRPDPIKLGKRI